jgi:hypothetical protein
MPSADAVVAAVERVLRSQCIKVVAGDGTVALTFEPSDKRAFYEAFARMSNRPGPVVWSLTHAGGWYEVVTATPRQVVLR